MLQNFVQLHKTVLENSVLHLIHALRHHSKEIFTNSNEYHIKRFVFMQWIDLDLWSEVQNVSVGLLEKKVLGKAKIAIGYGARAGEWVSGKFIEFR